MTTYDRFGFNTLDMPNAWIVCWDWDETHVYIRPDGRDGKQVRCAVLRDPVAKRLYCEYRGQQFHLMFE